MFRLSPVECRLVARAGWRKPLGLAAIALRARLSIQKALWISSQPDWEKVTVGDALRFAYGCGVTQRNQSRHAAYLKRTRRNKKGALAHLDGLSAREKQRLLRLLG